MLIGVAGLVPGGLDESLGPSPVQAGQRRRHAFSGQLAHIHGLGLLEEFRDIARGHGVAVQSCFEPTKPGRHQHQQPGDKRHERPQHKLQVNTAKVSAGSRISTLSG